MSISNITLKTHFDCFLINVGWYTSPLKPRKKSNVPSTKSAVKPIVDAPAEEVVATPIAVADDPIIVEPSDKDETVEPKAAISDQTDEELGLHIEVIQDDPASDLISPITFDGKINDQGELINEQVQRVNAIVMANNSKLIKKYPRLKEIESRVRSEGFDCHFFEKDSLIIMSILQDGIPMNGMVFTIDINKVVLGPEPKWIPGYNPSGNFEDLPCVSLNDLGLMMRVVKKEATPDEVYSASIYDEKYITVSRAISINSFFPHITPAMKKKMIDRLYTFIKKGYLDQSGYDYKSKFNLVSFTSIVRYTMRSDDKQIDVGKEKIVVGDIVK